MVIKGLDRLIEKPVENGNHDFRLKITVFGPASPLWRKYNAVGTVIG
jgi:hypothetical protein